MEGVARPGRVDGFVRGEDEAAQRAQGEPKTQQRRREEDDTVNPNESDGALSRRSDI